MTKTIQPAPGSVPKLVGSPGPLFLVGLGLCDETDVPPRSLDALRSCARVYAESYTNLMREGTIKRLEAIIRRPITQLGREEVEGEKEILSSCQKGATALLVPGDPMTATTHESLRQAARAAHIKVRILHASSIFTAAAGASGLHIYKFGKTATITYWRQNFEPTSFLDPVRENLSRGAHSLCLLDIDSQLGPMKPSTALQTIKMAQKKQMDEKEAERSVLLPATPLFVLWHVGWPDQKIWAGALKDFPYLPGDASEPPGPAVIILPGKMHFAEEESFRQASGAKG